MTNETPVVPVLQNAPYVCSRIWRSFMHPSPNRLIASGIAAIVFAFLEIAIPVIVTRVFGDPLPLTKMATVNLSSFAITLPLKALIILTLISLIPGRRLAIQIMGYSVIATDLYFVISIIWPKLIFPNVLANMVFMGFGAMIWSKRNSFALSRAIGVTIVGAAFASLATHLLWNFNYYFGHILYKPNDMQLDTSYIGYIQPLLTFSYIMSFPLNMAVWILIAIMFFRIARQTQKSFEY